LEHYLSTFQAAVALDVDLLIGVHQDIRNLWILDERFQRTEPKDLVQHLYNNCVPLLEVERYRFLSDQVLHYSANCLGYLLTFEPIEVREIQALEQFTVNPTLYLLEGVHSMRALAGAGVD
jgi:hypothetical protein